MDTHVKRQASPTADHSLEYRHFEGVLEEGQEGAGTVIVWNEGTYAPEREKAKGVWGEVFVRAEAEAAMHQGLAVGMLTFRLYEPTSKRIFLVFSMLVPTGRIDVLFAH